MKIWRFALAALAVMVPIGAMAADGDILRCAGVKEDGARLKCFDDEAAKLTQSRVEAEKNAVGFFGFLSRFQPVPESEKPVAAPGEKPAPQLVSAPPKIQELSSKLAWVGEDGAGKTMIRLENGQVWACIESVAVNGAKPGANAVIRESSFNGFRLKIEGRSGEYRVKRVD